MRDIVAIIRRKRDGQTLTDADIDAMIAAITDGSAGEGQIAAFAMAVYCRGLNSGERAALTRAMTASGQRLDWSEFDRPVLDKHSTGGVGDKVSLILAPLLAACGACVPMISGRGLGHTGGTLDKLDSIPGYRTAVERDRIAAALAAAGCAIVGQTERLAPADRKLYAVRDVTATVDSIDLIVASILSKKLAAGLDALVLDVKTGSGAFMGDLDRARRLADALCAAGRAAGLPTRALISDMNQVLGDSCGNALEVDETLAFLRGERREPRLLALCLALGGELLTLGGLCADRADAETRLRAALDRGDALQRFARMVESLGGPADFCDRPRHYLGRAPVQREVPAPTSGFVSAIDVRAIGDAVVRLGGGRRRTGDAIDHRVGFSAVAGLGARLDGGRPLALAHAASEDDAADAAAALAAAYRLSSRPPAATPLLYDDSQTDG